MSFTSLAPLSTHFLTFSFNSNLQYYRKIIVVVLSAGMKRAARVRLLCFGLDPQTTVAAAAR